MMCGIHTHTHGEGACAMARVQPDPFDSPADLEDFFRECDALEGSTPEPDWVEHVDVINESRSRGASNT